MFEILSGQAAEYVNYSIFQLIDNLALQPSNSLSHLNFQLMSQLFSQLFKITPFSH